MPAKPVVKQGTWVYENVLCDVRIVMAHVRPGTGDSDDEPEWRNDQPGPWFEIQYGSTTERHSYNSGGGFYPTLNEAVAKVEQSVTGVRWFD